FEPGSLAPTPVDGVSAVVVVIMFTGALGTILFHRHRLLALVMMSTVGLVTSLIFVRLSAPDLAMTQLSVEVVTILLLLLALHHLPETSPGDSSTLRKWRDGILATAGGASTALIAWAIMTRPFESISDWHLDNSYKEGGGDNVVNVILVDFRGFDTMLEISVLTIAALGIYMLLDNFKVDTPSTSNTKPASDAFPLILTAVTRPLMFMVILMSVFILLRGHNLPGGGFIGGLVATVAIVMQDFASGAKWTEARINVDFQKMALVGVAIAVLTGAAALLLEHPFLSSWHDYVELPLLAAIVGELHLASAMVFDVGVYFAVIGSLMVILTRMGRLGGTTEPVDYEYREERSPWKP
ncbi:MAG: hydrogen gas-evolving membrane-bound hydrogenase subunit E, partial [Persicimonas sp.]